MLHVSYTSAHVVYLQETPISTFVNLYHSDDTFLKYSFRIFETTLVPLYNNILHSGIHALFLRPEVQLYPLNMVTMGNFDTTLECIVFLLDYV